MASIGRTRAVGRVSRLPRRRAATVRSSEHASSLDARAARRVAGSGTRQRRPLGAASACARVPALTPSRASPRRARRAARAASSRRRRAGRGRAAPAARPPASSSGTTSGKPVRPRGHAGDRDRDDRRSRAERRRRRSGASRAPPSASAWPAVPPSRRMRRELVAALRRGHRRGVDQRERGEQRWRGRRRARRPTPRRRWTACTRVEVLGRGSSGSTPGWSAA